jgi:hypothetical protein
MTGAMGAGHPERGPHAGRARDPVSARFVAALVTTLLLGACAGPAIRHHVLTPPPSAPRTAFVLEAVDVQSREVGEEAWKRNEAYGALLMDALRAALAARGKAEVQPPGDRIRPRVYLAHGDAPVAARGSRRAKAHVEVRLQLLDAQTGAIRYSTHTQAPIAPTSFFGLGGKTSDEIIREVLQQAAQDFVSRL